MADKIKNSKENYLLVYPKQVKDDIGRAVNTLGFIDKKIPDQNLSSINGEIDSIDKELDAINKNIEEIKSKNKEIIDNLSHSLDYYEKSDELVSKMAKGDKYLYLSGWVPDSKIDEFTDFSDKYEDTTVTVKKDTNQSPPTKLKNNKLFRPFEFLVNMYGAPNYNEIDPTPFFAISYMLLYGMMFGDLGQGLVFVLLSFLVDKKNKTFGALLRRIGFSACFFGIMYGSIFGIETLIPALLIKPFDNIMKVLIASVAFGIGLLVIAYFMGIYNKLVKQKNIEEGIFGKEGIAGLMMLTSFVLLILNIVNVSPIPKAVGIVMLILSIVMIVFSKPIGAKIEKRDHTYESTAFDYYVESSFSIIEALLSVFSNLVSFTRVGAFAINHVGLYMAFEVMSEIAGGGIKGLIILILGNILIIGLEGMIVFIQGLRLEFYEMFSKYYQGNGRKFRPIKESN